jgi:hypothetical protein
MGLTLTEQHLSESRVTGADSRCAMIFSGRLYRLEKISREPPSVALRVPGLSCNAPRARVLDQQEHFYAAVHVGIVFSNFATSSRNGDVAEDSNLNPQDRLREGSKLGAGKALHASDEVLGALGFDWTRSGIERGAGQEVGCEGVPIASRAGSPIQTPELAPDQIADRFLILGHGAYASPRFLEDK